MILEDLNLEPVAKGLMIAGIALFGLGLLILLGSRLGLNGIPFGRLPGDVNVRSGGVQIFAPFATMLLLSLLLSGILFLIGRFTR